MSSYVLLPGAGGAAAYWSRVAPILEAAGHEAIAVRLPGADEEKGLSAYADITLDAIGSRRDVVLVAQSMGGFTAPLVCAQVTVKSLVFVNAMIPVPGETAGKWWGNTGSEEARVAAAKRGGYGTEIDLETYFLHDVPKAVADELLADDSDEAKIAFGTPCEFAAWPSVPIHVVIGKDDRLFPAAFQERVARERLGTALTSIDVVPGGHLVALSNPEGLAARLLERAS